MPKFYDKVRWLWQSAMIVTKCDDCDKVRWLWQSATEPVPWIAQRIFVFILRVIP